MRKYSKWIAAFIALVMMVALVAACNGDDDVTPTPTPGTADPPTVPVIDEEPPPPDHDYMVPFSRYDETVTISVGRMQNLGGAFVPGQDEYDNVYLDILYDALNIAIDVKFSVAPEDYMDTIIRHAAANDLPDTFWLDDSPLGMRTFNELVENNLLADLSEILNVSVGGKSREEIRANWNEQVYQFVMGDNGEIFATPNGREPFNTPMTFVRSDWLDELNLPVPTTIAEIEATAKAFVENEMGGPGTTGITFIPEGMYGQWLGAAPIYGAMGSYPDMWIDVNGRAEYGGVQPETKAALGLLRGWVEDGLIPLEMMSMTSGDLIRDTWIQDHKCGIFFSAWWQPWPNWNDHGAASVNRNEGMDWLPVLGPVNAQGQFRPKSETVSPGGQVVLASFAHPEAVIKGMNFYAEVYEWKSEDFKDIYEELIKPAEAVTAARTNVPFPALIGPFERTATAEALRNMLQNGIEPDENTQSMINVDYFWGAVRYANEGGISDWWALSDEERNNMGDDNPEEYARWMEQYVGHWAFGYVGNLYSDSIASGVYLEMPHAYIGSTDSMDAYWGAMDDLQKTTFIQIIAGVLPLDAFDEFVTQWYSMGGDVITDEVNAIVG